MNRSSLRGSQKRWFLPTFVTISLFLIFYYWLPSQQQAYEQAVDKLSMPEFTDNNFHSSIAHDFWLIEL
jgi:hypothetical protein